MEMLSDTTEEERAVAMDVVFRVAKETGVNSLTEVWKGRRQHVPEMLHAIRKLPKEQRSVAFAIVSRTLRMITRYYGAKR